MKIGDRIGGLTIEAIHESDKQRHHWKCDCRCEGCGKLEVRTINSLARAKCTTAYALCKPCGKKRRKRHGFGSIVRRPPGWKVGEL